MCSELIATDQPTNQRTDKACTQLIINTERYDRQINMQLLKDTISRVLRAISFRRSDGLTNEATKNNFTKKINQTQKGFMMH